MTKNGDNKFIHKYKKYVQSRYKNNFEILPDIIESNLLVSYMHDYVPLKIH